MKQGFLEQEAKQANKKNRKLFSILFLVYICLIAVVGFAVKDVIDFNDYTTRKVIVCIGILTAVMLISVAAGFISSVGGAGAGKKLILPFQENSKEEVGKIIDREVAEGKIRVDEYTDIFSEGKKPHGERIMLLPSYLLIFNGMGRITAIPCNKIYWLCAQPGRKGRSSFIVRLLIFTEKKTFYAEGADVGHFEKIADKLYQYIPNVFSNYDPYVLSYELEELFNKKREDFLKFYEEEKRKKR